MSKAGENILVRGMTGKFGDQAVFRKSNGQTIMSDVSHHKVKPTPAMQKQWNKFRHAAKLAKVAIRDPEKRARYEAARKPGQTAYNVALSEFLNMLIAGKREPIPTPPYRKKAAKGIKTKDITLVIDTDKGMVVKTGLVVPDEHLQWFISAAKSSTSGKVQKMIVLINCI